MGAAKRGRDGQREALGETTHRCARRGRPPAATQQHDRPLGRRKKLLQADHVARAGPDLDGLEGGCVGDGKALDQHVLGQCDHDRPGPPPGGDVEGARNKLGDAGGIVDLRRPLGDRSEHGAVIEFLEGLALAHLAPNLPDKQNERCGILSRNMQPRRRIGSAGPARDEADARPPGCLAAGFRHDGSATLVTTNRNRDIAVVKRIEGRDIALAGYAEYVPRAVDDELIDQNFGRRPRMFIGAHHASPMILPPAREHAASTHGGQMAMPARGDRNCSRPSERAGCA